MEKLEFGEVGVVSVQHVEISSNVYTSVTGAALSSIPEMIPFAGVNNVIYILTSQVFTRLTVTVHNLSGETSDFYLTSVVFSLFVHVTMTDFVSS